MRIKKFLIFIVSIIGLSIGFGFNITGNICTCYNATDCNNAIANESCSVIKLGADINGQIVFNGVSNKILDGQGHKISYISSFWHDSVIEFNNTNNITIKNCSVFSGTNVGIMFEYNSINTNITIKNCDISGTNVGITFNTGSTNTNIVIENNTIIGSDFGIWFSGTNTNIITIGNMFNISVGYIIIFSGIVNSMTLDNGIYGNYWGKTDGTGYSDTCNDTDNDGICDQPYEVQTYYNIMSSNFYNTTTLKLNTLKLATLYVDYKPLAKWPYNGTTINKTNINVETNTENICYCSTANDCNTKIANESCSVIKLTADINGKIVFNGVSNKILDGQGHTINVDYNHAIYFSGTNNNITIENCNINAYYEGIWLGGIKNINISIINCNISTFGFGILLTSKINKNFIIKNCKINGVNDGIVVTGIEGNSIENVKIKNSTIISEKYHGIWLYFGSNIKNMTIKNSNISKGIMVYTNNISNLKIINTTLEDGKYIKILENVKNIEITNNSSIGQLILINTSNVRIQNLFLEQTLIFVNNSDVLLKYNDITGTDVGILFCGNNFKIKIMNDNIESKSVKNSVSIQFIPYSNNVNITVENNIIKGTSGIYFMDYSKNTNISITGNKFNVSNNFIYLRYGTTINNLTLNNSCCGNYWGKTDGTGYSDICNDTDNDGICEQPFNPVTVESWAYRAASRVPETKTLKKLKLEENKYQNNKTLKLLVYSYSSSSENYNYTDYKPLKAWPCPIVCNALLSNDKTTKNLTYNPTTNSIIATIYSDSDKTVNYDLDVEGASLNNGNLNLSKGENNISISFGDIKPCGVQNVTLKIGNETITKELDFGPCDEGLSGSGSGVYSVPENPLYPLIVLIISLFYLINRKDQTK